MASFLYSGRDFWDQRYHLDPQPFDWYCRLGHNPFKSALLQTMRPADRTLILGSGTSRLAEELWAENFKQLHKCATRSARARVPVIDPCPLPSHAVWTSRRCASGCSPSGTLSSA